MSTEPPALPEDREAPDGAIHRRAARVLLVDDTDEHVLMVRGFDPAEPEVVFWFTIGGGVHPGEDPRAAAVREAFEETGIGIDPEALVGPVQPEQIVFGFDGVTVYQEQEFYLARVAHVEPNTTGLDELEVRSTVGISWVRLDAIAELTETVYPGNVLDLVALLRDAQPPRPRV